MHGYAAPPKLQLPVPDGELAKRYEAGASLAEIATDLGVSYQTIGRRIKGRVRRRTPHEASNYDAQQTQDVSRLWATGLSARQISDRLGIRHWTVYRRLKLAGWDADAKKLRELYLEKRLPMSVIGQRLHMSPSTVSRKLKELGIEPRTSAGKVRQPIAPSGAVRPVFIAAAIRRQNGLSERSLTPKQRDLLDIVRASPQPISTGAIRDVAVELPREWRSVTVGNIGACLKRLDVRGLLSRIAGEHRGERFRGAPVYRWLPASADFALPGSEADANRLRELQVLIAEQAQEDEFGHWVRPTGAASLDAPVTASGFTILDTFGDEDEALAELVGEAA